MKILAILAIFFSMMASLAYCETEITEKNYRLQKCQAPIAKIVLGKMRCKATQCQKTDGSGTGGGVLQQILYLVGQPNIEGIGEGISDM